MFYNKKTMNSEILSPAWKAAHDVLTIESIEKISLPNICEALNDKVNSKRRSARKRFSLRTSANFITGAARLYKMCMKDLYEDAQKLDTEITQRKRRLEGEVTATSPAKMPSPGVTAVQMHTHNTHDTVESSKRTELQSEHSKTTTELSPVQYSEHAIEEQSTSKRKSPLIQQSVPRTESHSKSQEINKDTIIEVSKPRTESVSMECTQTTSYGQSEISMTESEDKNVIDEQSTSKRASPSIEQSVPRTESHSKSQEISNDTIIETSKSRTESVSMVCTKASSDGQSEISMTEGEDDVIEEQSTSKRESPFIEQSVPRTESVSTECTKDTNDGQSEISMTECEDEDAIEVQSTSKRKSSFIEQSVPRTESHSKSQEISKDTIIEVSKPRTESVSMECTEATSDGQSEISMTEGEDVIEEQSTSKRESPSIEQSVPRTKSHSKSQEISKDTINEVSKPRTESVSMECTEATSDGQSEISMTRGEIGNVESQISQEKIGTNLEKSEGPAQILPDSTKKKDTGVQTSTSDQEMRILSTEFDKDLPFGCVTIYESYESKIPVKLILSSLNADVRELWKS